MNMKVPGLLARLFSIIGLLASACLGEAGQAAITGGASTGESQPASRLSLTPPQRNAQFQGCSLMYQPAPPDGWLIESCMSDPIVPQPMQVVLNGASRGEAALVRIYHKSQHFSGIPQVAVIYANGVVRLKQNADPSPPIPFGASFILGPAYWPDDSTYYHHPRLMRLEIDTTWLPDGPLRMRATAANQAFAILYNLTLPPPRDDQTRLHVTQTYTATTAVSISSTRRSEKQGFKLVQISSMFITEDGRCEGGFIGCHNSNAARFIGSDLERRQIALSSLTPPAFILGAPLPLGATWLDALHTDDTSWRGNTPNVRIALDALPQDHTITPQGWIDAATNPNGDNVSLWLHDDGIASQRWVAGQWAQVSYWLIAQDNPPEPWADLGLRDGFTFLDFESPVNCYAVRDAGQSTMATVRRIAGYRDTAIQLDYDLGSANWNWAQVRCDFYPPLDLSAYDHLRFDWRGDPGAANSLQVGLITRDATGDHIFARGYHHVTHRGWWGQLIAPFQFLEAWEPGATLNPAQVVGVFVSVVKDGVDDSGGRGRLAIDNLNAYNVAARPAPDAFETAAPNATAARAAANWIAARQQSSGLVKSWLEESACNAYTYDQALALMVFVRERRWSSADALVDALVSTQNADGSWNQNHDCNTLTASGPKWEGDIAWAVYALSRYTALGGTRAAARTAMLKGTNFLRTRIASDGCLAIDHTEATIDAWWAFQAAGPEYWREADQIRNCLLTYYWDDAMGRFKGGRNWRQPYLDNQTWGAMFLRAIGEEIKARRALSYARATLVLPAQGAQLFGFDGQGGPWSVWNEGAGQYVAAGGAGAKDFLRELLAQQESDGALANSTDNFAGAGVWTTRWRGIAPTAWLYFALTGEPLHATRVCWLPLVVRGNSVTGR